LVFASRSSPSSSGPGGTLADIALIVIGGSAFLITVILWFDNAQAGLTGNGVFKSMELRPWIADPANAPLYPSNYLYYPIYGALCRFLDFADVFPGDPRRQVPVLNALTASLCLVAVYLLVRAVTRDRVTALLAALFHIACSFVLLLAITNEDIMPSYTVMFAAMALAAVWFAEPTALRVVSVGLLFSVGWLFEWRLMFPTLPAMLVALWLCEPRLARRFGWIALFLATMVAAAIVAALMSRGHNGAVGPLQLLWTGKAVVSAWAGYTWAKVGYLSDGVAAYLLGIGITAFPGIPGWDIWRWVSVLASVAIGLVALGLVWPQRHDNRIRALVALFRGTFLAGEIFNLYGQPQDPQMQINVMAWLTVGWALVLVAARRRWGAKGLAAFAGLTIVLLAYNLWSVTPLRGQDTAWQRTVERLEREADPARTVFLLHDFDWTMVYAALHWGLTEPGTDTLGPPPQAVPKFKWIGFTGQVLRHPDWPAERHVADLRRQIDRALELGYDVLVARLWTMDLATLESSTGMVVDSARLEALRTMLHRAYTATPVLEDALAGGLYRLRPAKGH
jgi:hypothetical protein